MQNLIRDAESAGDYYAITREQINEFLKTPSYHGNDRKMTKAQDPRQPCTLKLSPPQNHMNRNFTYKNVAKAIPAWPFFGEEIITISTPGIGEADAIFIAKFPEHTKKGNIMGNITVTIGPSEPLG